MGIKGKESVTILRPGTKDRYGDTGPDVTVGSCSTAQIWPRASGEFGDRGTHTIDGLHISLPQADVKWNPVLNEADREIRPSDVVLARGTRWKIDGAVGDWRKKGRALVYLFEVMAPRAAG